MQARLAGMLHHAVIGDGALALLVGLHSLAWPLPQLRERQIDAALTTVWAGPRPRPNRSCASPCGERLRPGGGCCRHCGPARARRSYPCPGGGPAAAAPSASKRKASSMRIEMAIRSGAALHRQARRLVDDQAHRRRDRERGAAARPPAVVGRTACGGALPAAEARRRHGRRPTAERARSGRAPDADWPWPACRRRGPGRCAAAFPAGHGSTRENGA